ncbi:hypothetical protein [Sorangium sp. So ce131]|uniref:hypothetical protein n=1 Tax=Sorangium sp. So ce131 TaxID=3133282 RepID=UPI003F5DBA59
MNALKLDIESAPDGTVTLRLPQPGRFRVHLEATWEPLEVDRKVVFQEIRRRGHPDAIALLDRLGEDGIANPEALLVWGVVDDPTFERPAQPPSEQRQGIE